MSKKLFGFLKGLGGASEEEEKLQHQHALSQDSDLAKKNEDEESQITDEMIDFCIHTLQEILNKAEFEGLVILKNRSGNRVALEIADAGDDVGRLIGREGFTLECFQILIRAMFFQKFDAPLRLILDTGGYMDKKKRNFRQKAKNAANRVKQYGKSVALEPMNAADRRAIHVMFQDSDSIETVSEGEGRDRHVILHAK